jgi:hypothetical protein
MIQATATTAGTPGGTCTALIRNSPTSVHVARDVSVAEGDALLVQQVGALWVAVARLYAVPTETDYDSDAPPTTARKGTLVVHPVETRSYETGRGWRTDTTSVFQGDHGGRANHIGCAFYGAKPRTLAGATVTDAEAYVRRMPGGPNGSAPTVLRLLGDATRPAGSPPLTGSDTGPDTEVRKPGAKGWAKKTPADTFDVPTAWVQSIVDGTAGGLGIYDGDGDPYVRYAGRGDWAPAWTLTIQWER